MKTFNYELCGFDRNGGLQGANFKYYHFFLWIDFSPYCSSTPNLPLSGRKNIFRSFIMIMSINEYIMNFTFFLIFRPMGNVDKPLNLHNVFVLKVLRKSYLLFVTLAKVLSLPIWGHSVILQGWKWNWENCRLSILKIWYLLNVLIICKRSWIYLCTSVMIFLLSSQSLCNYYILIKMRTVEINILPRLAKFWCWCCFYVKRSIQR